MHVAQRVGSLASLCIPMELTHELWDCRRTAQRSHGSHCEGSMPSCQHPPLIGGRMELSCFPTQPTFGCSTVTRFPCDYAGQWP